MSFNLTYSVCLALACLSAGSTTKAQESNKPQYGSWGIDLTAMDPNVKPGNDFNRYASGAWLARTQIPPDQPLASLRHLMSDITEARLHELMEKAAAAAPARPVTLEQKTGAFYKAFMDEARLDTLGAAPIGPELSAIRAAKDRQDIAELMGRNNADFYATIFSLGTDVDLKDTSRYAVIATQGGLGLPDRDYYLKPSFASQKAAYQTYVAKLLTLVGWPEPETNAAAVVAFETRVADASWTRAQQRDVEGTYNPQTQSELAALAPGFAWQRFLLGADLNGVDLLVVSEMSAFPRIAAIYQSTPLKVLQAWEAFTVADNAAFYLAKPFSEARFQFRDKVLSGQPEEQVRWKRAIRAVSGGDGTGGRVDCFGNMGFGLGQLYTAQYFPPASKIKIEELVTKR